MSQRYGRTPSELLGISDQYTAYCLNEACAIIAANMDNGEQPSFVVRYKSYSELCKSILQEGG